MNGKNLTIRCTGAMDWQGRVYCDDCFEALPAGHIPDYSWSHGAFCYEEHRCPKCGQKITMVRMEAAR